MKLWILILAAAAAAGQTMPSTLTLTEALNLAEQSNPGVQMARLRALGAFASARQTAAALGPQLSVQTSASYQTSNLAGIGLSGIGLPARLGPYRVFDARPRLTQTALDLSLLASANGARLHAEAAETGIAAVTEEVRLAVIQLYLQALQAE